MGKSGHENIDEPTKTCVKTTSGPEQSLRRSTALCCFSAAKRDILAVVVEEMIRNDSNESEVLYTTSHPTNYAAKSGLSCAESERETVHTAG